MTLQHSAEKIKPASALSYIIPLVLAPWPHASGWSSAAAQTREVASSDDDCRIKGNISWSGERIYHVPGGQYYKRTRIDPSEGERWFCTEEEAQSAGWRRSMR